MALLSTGWTDQIWFGNKIINKDGIDVSKEFNLGSSKEIERVKEFNATVAIMKSKSPSCGKDYIYDGTFSNRIVEGDGIFIRELKKMGIKILTELDFN